MRLLLSLFVVSLLSCNNSAGQKTNFKSEWPGITNSTSLKSMIKKRNSLLSVLGLKDISNGVDSFELRFGYNMALTIGKDFYVIRFENNKWQGFHYYYEQKDSVNNHEEDLDYSSKLTDLRDTFVIHKPFTPLISFDKLIDSITYSGILNIPSQIDIKGYRSRVEDGHSFWLEYSTKNRFSYIRYENPKEYKEFKESDIVLDFIKIFYRNIPGKDACWPRCSNK